MSSLYEADFTNGLVRVCCGVCVCIYIYMRMHSEISELIDKIQHEQLGKLQLSTKAIPSKLE